MFGLSRRLRVFAYGAPTDMRKSFNTLAALVLEMGMSAGQLQDALSLLDDELNRAKEEPGRSPSTERRGASTASGEKKPQVGHGPTPQPNLPVEPVVHELDEADQKCAACGGQLALWEGQDDETEEIDVIERRFIIKKNVRKKYRCRCGCVEMALMPERLVPGGRYSNDFAVEVADAKYNQHLPFERQVRAMESQGLIVENQTLWDQVSALATKLEPTWAALATDAIRSSVLGFDETSWQVLTKGSASRKRWTMWQLSTRRVLYFTIAPDGDKVAGNKLLGAFTGTAVGDAAQIHKAMARDADFRLAFCWAHARRRFIKAETSEPVRAAQFLGMVAELYAIEAQAPPGAEGDELRRTLRNEKSRPVTERIKQWMVGQRFLPESDIGAAIKYVARCWDGLCIFLDDPAVPIDNNRTERGFRGPALGRNNFYGSHSKRGTEVAAILYSLVETAKLNGKDPKRYLKAALAAALAGEPVLLPHTFNPD